MNVEALKKTIETKEAHYFSRSRKAIWHKGKTSGFIQKVTEIRIDDDQDSIWLTVDIGDGASCHVGYRSCFYRSIPTGPIENGRKVEMKAYKEYFGGYKVDPDKILDKTFGDVDGYDDMVIQKNISVQSHCEHHMAPIIGKAHVAYIPKERVVGLSKLARVVEVFSKRLQTQERLTMQIANTLMESLDAKGVAVTIDSTHQCMTCLLYTSPSPRDS